MYLPVLIFMLFLLTATFVLVSGVPLLLIFGGRRERLAVLATVLVLVALDVIG